MMVALVVEVVCQQGGVVGAFMNENEELLRQSEYLDQFISSWRSLQEPRIENFQRRLREGDGCNDVFLTRLLVELVEADFRLRMEAGERPHESEYASRFPEAADSIAARLAATVDVVPDGLSTKTGAPPSQLGAAQLQIQSDRERNPAALQHGSRFGDYEIIDEIARGGMGVVYKARQIKLNRTVAVKMILSGQLASEADVKRFYSEAESAAKLDHPGIVPIFEVGQHAGQHYFSMGFVDGESLSARIARGPLSPRDAAELTKKITEAVAYAHEQGIIHRDLKPHNVLLTVDGEPKVTDFGLAAQVEGEHELTTTGQILGTPGYMPPEQAQGRINDIGPESDLYSLGGVLYCLLTGRPPFQMPTMLETIKHVIESPPVSPRSLNPAIDRDLETICLKCLEKDKVNRFRSARDLTDELQRYLNGEPIRSRPVGLATRGWRWCRRNPLGTSLAAALLVVLLTVVVAISFGRSASEARQVANLKGTIERQLDQVETKESFLEEMETAVDQLRPYDEAYAQDAWDRAVQSYAEELRKSIVRAKLTPADVDGLGRLIDGLAARDRPYAETLRQQLRDREQQWLVVRALDTSLQNASEIFPEKWTEGNAEQKTLVATDQAYRISQQQAALLPTPAEKSSLERLGPRVDTLVEAEAFTMFEVQFAKNWEDAKSLGLTLNATDRGGYEFVLVAPSIKIVAAPDEEASLATDKDTSTREQTEQRVASFRVVRTHDRAVYLEIRRSNVALLRREIPISQITSGPLVLRAIRERNVVSIQVNRLAVESFRDPFPISTKSVGYCSLRWPRGVGVVGLQVSHKPRPPAPSRLEQGDDLYDQEKFAEALAYFREQALDPEDDFYLEAMYKAGMSLMRLGRSEEASAVLHEVFQSDADVWPPLAGCQLWLAQILEQDEVNANSTFDAMDLRFDFRALAQNIPDELRSQILAAYQSELATYAGMTSYSPNIVARMQRVAAVDRMFSLDGLGNVATQIEVARAYRFVGDFSAALTYLRPLALRSPVDALAMRHYLRVLRMMGRPSEALQVYRQHVREDGQDGQHLLLVVELARVYAALEDWNACERLVDERIHRFDPVGGGQRHDMTYFLLMKGFLLQRQGKRGEAIAVWREGYAAGSSIMGHTDTATQDLVNTLIMGSLSESLKQEDVSYFWNLLQLGERSSPLIALSQTLINPRTLAAIVRGMWRSERGRKYAELIAFEQLTMRERVRIPAQLLAMEFVRVSGAYGDLTEEQETYAFDSAEMLFEATVGQGATTAAQAAQFAVTWKGVPSFIGWDRLKNTLPSELLQPAAYFCGLRYLRLNKPDMAKGMFETVRDSVAEDSLPARMVSRQLELLSQQQGALHFIGPPTQEVEVQVRRGDETVETLQLRGESVVHLPVGDFQLQTLQPEDIRIEPASVSVAVGQHRVVTVQQVWEAPPCPVPACGLLEDPSTKVTGGRWQIHRQTPTNFFDMLAASPDGKRYALGEHSGVTYIHDAETHARLRMLNTMPSALKGAAWHPDSRRLVQWGYGPELQLVDSHSGVVLRTLKVKATINDAHWHPEGTTLALAPQAAEVRLYDPRLAQTLSIPLSTPQRIRWHPGGDLLAVVGRGPDNLFRLDVIRVEDQVVVASFPLDRKQPAGLEWSPDGKRLATVVRERELQVWDSRDWSKEVESPSKAPQRVSEIAWLSDRQVLLGCHEGTMLLVDVVDKQTLHSTHHGLWNLRSMARIPGSTRILLGGIKPALLEVDPASNEHRELIPQADQIMPDEVAAHPQFVVMAPSSKYVWWLERTGRVQRIIDSLPARVLKLAIAADGARFAIAFEGGSLQIYAPDGKLLKALETPGKEPITGLSWSPAATHLAVVQQGEPVRVWDVVTGSMLPELKEPQQIPTSVAWRDEKHLFVGTQGGAVLQYALDGKLLDSQAVVKRPVKAMVPAPRQEASTWPGLLLKADSSWFLRLPDGTVTAQLNQYMIPADVAWNASGDEFVVVGNAKQKRFDATGKKIKDQIRLNRGTLHTRLMGEQHMVEWQRGINVRFWSWNREENEPALRSVVSLLPTGEFARWDASGRLRQYRCDLDRDFLYSVEDDTTQQQLLAPTDFHRQYGLALPVPTGSEGQP